MKRPPNSPGRIFQRLLWGNRLLVLVAVVAGVVLAVGSTYLATMDVVYFVGLLLQYTDPGLGYQAREELQIATVTAISGASVSVSGSGVQRIWIRNGEGR